MAEKSKLKKKKPVSILLSLLSLVLLSGCSGLKTPEELIGPPEVSLERKIIEDTIRKFLPANAEIITPQDNGESNSAAAKGTRIIGEDSEEVITLYRDKVSRKVGILSIKRNGNLWSKLLDMPIDAFEVADYNIVDLDGDGKNEILIGYFSVNSPFKSMMVLGYRGGIMSKVYETEYLGFNIGESQDGGRSIAFSTVGSEGRNNKFIIMDYENGSIKKSDEFVYPENIDIYKITYGSINDEEKGFYLDMYVDESTGKSDILGRNEEGLYSIIKKTKMPEIVQDIPMASTDINNDGNIELVQNRLLKQENESAAVILNEYISINNKEEFVYLVNILEDHYNNIKIILPPLKDWGIEDSVQVKSEKDMLSIKYYSQEQKSYHKFLEIKIIPLAEKFDNSYSLIMERGNTLIIGKKIQMTDMSYLERVKLDDFFGSIGVLAEIVKVIE